MSELYRQLLTTRKDTVSDERYDLKTDPQMTRNLAGTAADPDLDFWRRVTERAFEELVGGDGQIEFSPEERERLKALGYIAR